MALTAQEPELTPVQRATLATKLRLQRQAAALAAGPVPGYQLGRLAIIGVVLSDAAVAGIAAALTAPAAAATAAAAAAGRLAPGALASITELRLVAARFGPAGVASIAAVLPGCPRLAALDLTGSAAGTAGLRAIAAAATGPGCGLRAVALSFNVGVADWSKPGLEDGMRALTEALPHTRLSKLTVSDSS